jgi:hypothetical protein
MAGFISGLELAAGFFADHVQPTLAAAMVDLEYSAALIGSGSEVLGFDTAMSMDHHWGPRAMLFLRPDDHRRHASAIQELLARRLPPTYRGISTHFTAPDPDDNGTQLLAVHQGGPINHRVDVLTIDGFLRDTLGTSNIGDLDATDWLGFPSQRLLSIKRGKLFRDDLGLGDVQARLDWYPQHITAYILGCLWTRVGQEEHLMGRAGYVGDELGSSVIAARIVRDLMRIAFCLESEYAPYAKWLGSAFSALPCSSQLHEPLSGVVSACDWQTRQAALAKAYERLLEHQHSKGWPIGDHGRVRNFWSRPFSIIGGGEIASAVFERIEHPTIARLARSRPIGNVDLISDNTDVVDRVELHARLRSLYEA